jgi:predicted dithiol-disulfide oxidoreductase (DUF899 family)
MTVDADKCPVCAPGATVGSEVSVNRSALDQQIDALEMRIAAGRSELAALRRRRKPEIVADYEFQDWSGAVIRLSQLSSGQRDLIIVHNMGVACSYCTLWADGFVGLAPYLTSRTAFVVASPDPIDVQKAFAIRRGWTFRMVSSRGTSFFLDMGFADCDGGPMPGVSVFRCTENGPILRVQRAEFGPGDPFCAVWHFFVLLAEGANGWEPPTGS